MQDLPPIGGYEPIQWKRNLPSRGFRGSVYFWGIAGLMGFGFYRYYQGVYEQREFTRERNWARFHLEPLLIAEEDRNVARRYFAELERRELVKQNMSAQDKRSSKKSCTMTSPRSISQDSPLGRHNDTHPYHGFNAKVALEVQELARTISHASVHQLHLHLHKHASRQSTLKDSSADSHAPLAEYGVVPIDENGEFVDPRLNPDSTDFNAAYWISNAHRLVMSDTEYFKPIKIGVAYKNLRAYGNATDADYQSTFLNTIPKYVTSFVREKVLKNSGPTFDILKPMDGLLKPGEMTVVLGRPGAGCSTFLKTIASQTHGFHDISRNFRGEVVYCAETETHFPQLSVGDTLEFAARMRTPQNRPLGVSREEYAKHIAAVAMALFGLGVSGGERKRVSIAEITLNNAKVQCWDNSTRGLDSATALEFVRAVKAGADIIGNTPLIAIYQCSQDAYDLFDKVVLMYEGYQIYFGSAKDAKQYFLDMDTADFLTSLTNPAERIVKAGYEASVPRTPQDLVEDIDRYLENRDETEEKNALTEAHKARQSNHMKPASPYMVSFFMQVRYIAYRNLLRIKGNPSVTLFLIFANTIMSLILSSIFYNLPNDTSSFYHRTAALFFAVLFNAFSCILEIFALYEARPIVEKHKKYALYHPGADACATIGAATKKLEEAMTPAAILLLALTISLDMRGWSRWINYINPLAYAFESLMANEFHGRDFDCPNRICSPVGSVVGQAFVSGTAYLEESFVYRNLHKWRNFGILIGYMAFFFCTYILLCEINKGAMQKGEILLFQKRGLKKMKKAKKDIESGELPQETPSLKKPCQLQQRSIQVVQRWPHFFWRNLTYQPGQVTALMGASGAGKTTLLNALSDRLTSGEVTDGIRLVDGKPLDSSFQRSIGYEKIAYVDHVIELLEMEKYADAVVGVSGEGLNVEQRKRLSIGVELVAKPKLLVFLDEPTSGLDSQTAWSICKLIRKLADNGQAILCTIHQPSAILLAEFDRLLFLQRGGQTVYFGDLGKNFSTLINYFEKYANPAEWMLEVIGAAPGSKANQDYYDVWLNSTEFQEMNQELDFMQEELVKRPEDDDPDRLNPYASPTGTKNFRQNWRTPTYIYSKLLLVIASSLFNGFSFYKASDSLQFLPEPVVSVFMLFPIVHTLVQQLIPTHLSQRDLYEGAFMWFAIVLFFIYTSSLGQMCISFLESGENAVHLAVLLLIMCLAFAGVLVSKDDMPGFWIFMYRFNPFTYLISVILSEYLRFPPPQGYTCQQYMQPYMSVAGGYLVDGNNTVECAYCTLNSKNVFLHEVGADYSTRGRDVGIFIAFIAFNMICTFCFYYLPEFQEL
ncbi:ABC transporter CDR4 [Candida viswanathii]|uniref:ABC transporter CDR4 n=1 Tax=Candida viswanathii TaxID=5486 RepID=A0A367XS26_9ASCO|nr:ABC transporter CDR4 [Candida viswanathii]